VKYAPFFEPEDFRSPGEKAADEACDALLITVFHNIDRMPPPVQDAFENYRKAFLEQLEERGQVLVEFFRIAMKKENA
jgi:hypothetical protein